MICARCDEQILQNEKHEAVSVDGASGPGITIYRHAFYCRPTVPRQTAPLGPAY